MKLITKFNLRDHAWYMNENKPIEVIISSIEIFYVGTNQSYIKYNATDASNPVTWLDHTNLFEYALFVSKEELLESL